MIEKIDLKAMKLLIDLNETHNTYATAVRLDLSQSAVARILNKCRLSLNDPLFIRSCGKLRPTDFAEQLISRLPAIVDEIEDAFSANKAFTPEKLKGKIQICINRPIQSLYSAELYSRLASEAPNATWYLKSWESSAVEQILDGRVLMGVNYVNDHFPKSIIQKKITEDEFVILASKNHPLAQYSNLGIDHLLLFGFISLTLPGWDEKSTYLNRIFETKPMIKLQTDSLTLAMQVTRSSDMLLPASLKMNVGDTGLVPLKINFNHHTALHASVVSIYAQKNSNKPVINWLNGILKQLVEEASN